MAFLIFFPTANAVAQEAVVGDSSRWMQPSIDHLLTLPGENKPLVPEQMLPRMGTFRLPDVPELSQPKPLESVSAMQRLSPETLRAMQLNPTDLQLMAAFPTPRFTVDPKAYDYKRSGSLLSWRTGFITASGDQQTSIGLMTARHASFSATQVVGRWTFSASAGLGKYQLHRGMINQWNVSAQATYQFNENLSATVFGNYYSRTAFAGLAAMTSMGSSSYGGFFTLKKNRWAIDLGVEQVFNPYTGRWETVPIVTPTIPIGRNFSISLPVGYMIKEAISGSSVGKHPSGNGIIAPEMPAINPRFTLPPGGENNF